MSWVSTVPITAQLGFETKVPKDNPYVQLKDLFFKNHRYGMPEREEQKKLRFLLKGYEEGWLTYEPREKKEIDFNKYTIAQVNEINNVLLLIRRIVDDAYRFVPENSGEGRPPKSACDKAKAVLMQQFFQCSNRVAEGFVELFREKLGIKERLTYKDIERAY